MTGKTKRVKKLSDFKFDSMETPKYYELKEAQTNPLDGRVYITFVRKGSQYSSLPLTRKKK